MSNLKLNERRKVALSMLQKQLVAGTKPNKFGTTKEKKLSPNIPLEKKDRDRIAREIEKLKFKITP